MKYNLFLLRHAKSDKKINTYDFERQITDKGKRSAQRLGVWTAQQKINPDLIICSPAKRAKLTAEKMLKSRGLGVDRIAYDRRLYLAEKSDIVKLLKEIPDSTKSVLIVAHNPGLEELLLSLINKETKKELFKKRLKIFPTGCFAQLTFSSGWKKLKSSSVQLEQIIYPKMLAKGFPYPAKNSKEMRIRPAYYYHQSAVIPYQINKGKLEILIISSSQNNHYVIPKGIIEPGLSPRQSAAKEALEEAGIRGSIALKPIGKYSVIKWKAEVNIEVYPMKVIEVIDEKHWQEKHRGRQWLDLKDAVKSIHHKQLKPMLIKLNKQLKSNKTIS